jgi:citrate/tricarballylate utilization protein
MLSIDPIRECERVMTICNACATGLALLASRDSAAMGLLLLAHLALVLTLFVSLPYGKLMHGLYRTAALIRYARESRYN